MIIGIDPGKNGGIGILRDDGTCHLTTEMPLHANGEISGASIEAFLHGVHGIAFIEKSQAMPKQGIVSAFNYGTGYGVIKGVLEALHIPYEEVHPRKWKKVFSLDSDKAQSITVAQKLFPDVVLKTQRGRILDGVAEALLIAEYGRRYGKIGTNGFRAGAGDAPKRAEDPAR